MTTPRDVISECACVRVRKASRAVSRAYDEAVRSLGIKSTQFSLLVAVSQGQGLSTSKLADNRGMDRTTLIRNMQLLEKQGLVATEIEERRRVSVLTAQGRSVLEQALPLWRQAQDQLVGRLGVETWGDTKARLKAITEAA
jgi:DNA-binding MarR family transcriptional regulator